MTVHLDVLDFNATAHVLDTSNLQLMRHEGKLKGLVALMGLQGIHTDFVLVDRDYDHKDCYKLTWSKESYALILLSKGDK